MEESDTSHVLLARPHLPGQSSEWRRDSKRESERTDTRKREREIQKEQGNGRETIRRDRGNESERRSKERDRQQDGG